MYWFHINVFKLTKITLIWVAKSFSLLGLCWGHNIVTVCWATTNNRTEIAITIDGFVFCWRKCEKDGKKAIALTFQSRKKRMENQVECRDRTRNSWICLLFSIFCRSSSAQLFACDFPNLPQKPWTKQHIDEWKHNQKQVKKSCWKSFCIWSRTKLSNFECNIQNKMGWISNHDERFSKFD